MKLEQGQLFPEEREIRDSDILTRYINGGCATLILLAPSGTYHTYQIEKPQNTDKFPEDVRFVYAKHDKQEFYIGMIENGRFRLTQNSRFLEDSDIVKGARFLIKVASNQLLLSKTPMAIYHTGRCARCGRELKDKMANKLGFGKKCLQKVVIEEMNKKMPAGMKEFNQQLTLDDIFA